MGVDLSVDGHTLVSLTQLQSWRDCPNWLNFSASPFLVGSKMLTFQNPCDYFSTGKIKAMTLSLSVLVSVEMLNAMNALSEEESLLTMPPWRNPWLLVAMVASFGMHLLILHVPILASIFGIVPLSSNEWMLVMLVSAPVVLIDEVLKLIARWRRESVHKVKDA